MKLLWAGVRVVAMAECYIVQNVQSILNVCDPDAGSGSLRARDRQPASGGRCRHDAQRLVLHRVAPRALSRRPRLSDAHLASVRTNEQPKRAVSVRQFAASG